MQISLFRRPALKVPHVSLALLILAWVGGLSAGYRIYRVAKSSFSALMLRVSSGSVSIVGFLLLVIFPFLISSIAVFKSNDLLIYILCFAKALSYSITVFSVFSAFGSAGWLVVCLVMFSSNCTLVSLFVLWWNCLVKRFMNCRKMLLYCFSISLSAVCLDITVISPFVHTVFHH